MDSVTFYVMYLLSLVGAGAVGVSLGVMTTWLFRWWTRK